MKIVAIHIARIERETAIFLSTKSDTSSFGFMERKAVRELSDFLARQILPKLRVGGRDVVSHMDYLFLGLRWNDGMAMSCLTDKMYPPRLGFKALGEIRDHFVSIIPRDVWRNTRKDNGVDYKSHLKSWLEKYQNPKGFDAIMSTQSKVDDTKNVLKVNIESVLGNQEQIESLLATSDDISTQSQMLFQTAKKANKSCCSMQ